MECHVVTDGIREREEQMRGARDGLDVPVQVAIEDEARLALDCALGAAARERAELHVGASGRSPAKTLSMIRRRARVRGRRLAWRFGWQRSGDRSVLGCAV